MTDTGHFKHLVGLQEYHSVNKPQLDASKALLEILRGSCEASEDANDDSTRNSSCSTSSTSSIPFGDINDDYWVSMEEMFLQQRKEMALCIYRQYMTRSGGSCDPSQIRRICNDLVHRTFNEVRAARQNGPSSMTHRTMKTRDERRSL